MGFFPFMTTLADKEHHLRTQLAALPSLVVAYSGGVDSTYLLHVAHAVSRRDVPRHHRRLPQSAAS